MKQLKRTYCDECKRYYSLYYFEQVHLKQNKHKQNVITNSTKQINNNIEFFIYVK